MTDEPDRPPLRQPLNELDRVAINKLKAERNLLRAELDRLHDQLADAELKSSLGDLLSRSLLPDIRRSIEARQQSLARINEALADVEPTPDI